MRETSYGLKVDLPLAYETALQRATEALKQEGFGVLTTIDVTRTLKEKLDRDFRRYVILGACNPLLADRALHAELDIGLLLPCNVVVRDTAHGVVVEAADPQLLVTVTEPPKLRPVADEAASRLTTALRTLERSG